MCPEKQTHGVIIYVDIKLLRYTLKDIRTARLEADKPAVWLLMLYVGFLANSSIGEAELIGPFPFTVGKFWHQVRPRCHGRGWHATFVSANQAPGESIRVKNWPNELAFDSQEDNIRLVLRSSRWLIHLDLIAKGWCLRTLRVCNFPI